jgi:ribosomal protein S12 methylthiotransferase accessory factor YcaO
VVLDEDLLARATRVFPFSRRDRIYFADVEIILRSHGIALGGSSLAFGREQAIAKCRSELLERWAHLEWELDGSPPLCGEGMDSESHYPDAIVTPPEGGPQRLDATGYCAGPIACAADILRHGLFEVLERDCMVRIFDRRDSMIRVSASDVPASLEGLLRRQLAQAEVFLVDRAPLPPTAIAVVRGYDGRSGAIGSACKLTPPNAAAAAVLEGVMMLTTVRHQQRSSDAAPHMRGLLWASRNITHLREELRERLSRRQTSGAAVGADPARAAEQLFGDEPVVVRFPIRRTSFEQIGVWRVRVPHAYSPLDAERQPWPIG